VYQDIVRAWPAAPVVFRRSKWARPLARGADGRHHHLAGGWGKNVQDAPSASLVPGLLFYTYFLIADKAWFDALPAAEPDKKALADSARCERDEKWGECRPTTRLAGSSSASGATYTVVREIR